MIDFVCCGVKYSKRDPSTYIYISSFDVSPVTKKYVNLNINNQSKKIVVKKELVDVLNCIKNGCTKIKIKRYGIFKGRYQLLEVEDMKNNIRTGVFDLTTKKEIIKHPANEFLEKTKNIRTRLPQICPLKRVPYSKHIPLSYGKVLSSTTQRARYINEQGWQNNSKVIKLPVILEKL